MNKSFDDVSPPPVLHHFKINLLNLYTTAVSKGTQMELITVSQTIIGQSAVNAVNSRELYEALGLAKGQYSRWAEKNIIEPYCLNEDYIGVRHDVEGNNITTFIVTIELAKHLAMMARTEKGKQIRDYFLECEKKAHSPQFQIPQTYSEALMLAA